MKQKLVKEEKLVITPGDFNVLLLVIDRVNIQKVSENIEDNSIHQFDLRDFYRILYPTIRKYTLFFGTHGTFTKIDYMLCNKAKQPILND